MILILHTRRCIILGNFLTFLHIIKEGTISFEWSFCCNTYFLSEEGSINASDVNFGFANQENATESDKKNL